MHLVLAFVFVALQGCVRADPPLPEAPAPAVAEAPAAGAVAGATPSGVAGEPVGADGGAAPPAGEAGADLDAQERYLACQSRVEGAESDGECTSDAGCLAQGCSGEVCAPAGSALMTTCEVLPCYEVLQSCGCQAGRCQWTVGTRPTTRDVPRPTRKAP